MMDIVTMMLFACCVKVILLRLYATLLNYGQ